MENNEIAAALAELANMLTAGCEKLPAGPMRENCEKKSKGGDSDSKGDKKKDDKGGKGKMPAEVLEKFKKKSSSEVRAARELIALAKSLIAGCEKLPEGGMRDNCEKKSKGGDKKDDKDKKSAVVAHTLVKLAKMLTAKQEVPEAFKKEWKNKDKDGDGKENEPKPDFLKDKKSSRRASRRRASRRRRAEKIYDNGADGVAESEVFEYLDDLRESGRTNMFGAARYVESELGLDRREAKKALMSWMKNFK